MYIDMDKIDGLLVHNEQNEGEKEKELMKSLSECHGNAETDVNPQEAFAQGSSCHVDGFGQDHESTVLNGKKMRHIHSHSVDGSVSVFGNGEFSTAEWKKVMDNEKLAEIALLDPKRVKRILANRKSAARSKERKMRYISELERKVQSLQTEATVLSAQLTLLQRDSTGLSNENSELKFKLQAMEQQANVRDALNDALREEVHRLRVVTGGMGGPQISLNQKVLQKAQHPQQQGSYCNVAAIQNHHHHNHEQKCQLQKINSQKQIDGNSDMLHSIMNSFMKAEGPGIAVHHGNYF